jgi:hypothetical protein
MQLDAGVGATFLTSVYREVVALVSSFRAYIFRSQSLTTQTDRTFSTIVGLNSLHGLWKCFLVSIDKSDRTIPCTERLLKLVKKGGHRDRENLACKVVRVGGSNATKIRIMRPIVSRKTSGFQRPGRYIPENGICFGDAGKLG